MSSSGMNWIFALVIVMGTFLRAQERPVTLFDETTVQGETVRLSDLLPFGVTPALHLAAETIRLGRAPEPGSCRVFSAAELRGAVDGAVALKFPEQVVVRGAGWPLRDAIIRRALRESEAGRRYDFSGAALIPPTDFATRNADPRLEVVAIRPGPDARTLSASLRCQQRSDCGSFLVEIVFDEALRAERLAQRMSGRPSLAKTSSANHGVTAVDKFALVQPGRPASLLFEGEGFKITTRVLPLQRAGIGQMVRVFDPAARHVSLAQVEGKDVLIFREAR